jgi:hypothetical protein
MAFNPRIYLYQNTSANAAGGYNSGWPIGRGGGIPEGGHDTAFLDGNNFQAAEIRQINSDDPTGIFRHTITGITNNGSGLCRVAITPAISSAETEAGLITGSRVAVGQIETGTTEANGAWTATVVSAGAIDLQGTSFVTAYTSGGFLFGGPLDTAPIDIQARCVPERTPTFNDSIGGRQFGGQTIQHVTDGPQIYAGDQCMILEPNETVTGCSHGMMVHGIAAVHASARSFIPVSVQMRGLVGLAPGYQLPGQKAGTQANFKASDKGYQTVNMGIGYFANNAPIGRPTAGLAENLIIKNNTTTPKRKIDFTADSIVLNGPLATCTDGTTMPTTTTIPAVNFVIDLNANGVQGLDTGSKAANKLYHVFGLYNSTTGVNGSLASLSETAPTLPSGYDYFGYVGSIPTDGSGNLYKQIQRGRDVQFTTAPLPVLNSGVQGNPALGNPSWSASSVVNYLPSRASTVKIILQAGGGVATSTAICAPNNTYSGFGFGANGPPIQFYIGVPGGAYIGEFLLESTNVYYACNLASGALSLLGYRLNT